jgi:hypothetical protein
MARAHGAAMARPVGAGGAGGAGHATPRTILVHGNPSREIFPSTIGVLAMNASTTTNPVGSPVASIATYAASAVASLNVEAARAAVNEEAKGLRADAWACATLIADAVLNLPADALGLSDPKATRAALFDIAASTAAETFKAARAARTGDPKTSGWSAFGSARSTIKGALYFGEYAPGLSKGALGKAVAAAKAAEAARHLQALEAAGLIAPKPRAEDAAMLATSLHAARAEAAELRDALAERDATIAAMRGESVKERATVGE